MNPFVNKNIFYIKIFYKKFLEIFKFITIIYLFIGKTYSEQYNVEIKPPKINAESYILIDYYSGQVLAEMNADSKRLPASLTKMMTSYIIGMYIKSGHIKSSDLVKISKESWMLGNPSLKGSSSMFLKPGDLVSISDLSRGIILQSGNDACVAIANYISGNQESFVELMNNYAKKLKLKNTHFKNVHGLDNAGQFTSARDMSIIGTYLIKDVHEEYIKYKEKEFTYNNIRQLNRNNLLWDKTLNVDGIKTGHTKLAGYNLVASAINENMRLISVILGGRSINERDNGSKSLLNWGLRSFNTILFLRSNEKFVKKYIFFGKTNYAYLGVKNDIYITVPRGKEKEIKIEYIFFDSTLKAPLKKYQQVGKIFFKLNNSIIQQHPLLVLENVDSGNIFNKILDYMKLAINHFVNN
ncbi:dacA [Wigglesworthia glossinidia endosymbiont of Glossina brevipalpis]|uniref:serine-type D-Ala-D-Ala carboxypeptidase n=1 Tax=Wigglesworthia glossinidia brevipalpis TaxID=36870 RepID=Q8D327_WIGBR|nr:dacA [Wigglesworthia glossinidia endosymbiont of Glossina brevipalpis]